MNDEQVPPLNQHQQPPPGLPNQVIAHPDNPHAPYSPSQEERTFAMLIHLLGILTGFLGPLILWLVKKDESHYIDHHGKEAINFMITCFIVSLTLLAVAVITLGVGLILSLIHI